MANRFVCRHKDGGISSDSLVTEPNGFPEYAGEDAEQYRGQLVAVADKTRNLLTASMKYESLCIAMQKNAYKLPSDFGVSAYAGWHVEKGPPKKPLLQRLFLPGK